MNQQLNPQQQAVATRIYADGVRGGLAPARAKEIALAAMHESGLRADAQGPPVAQYGGRRAAGPFQLLSDGYVQKANQHGGVFNVDANTEAILPDYRNYWQQHPNAPVGEAASKVERSGQGAGFYGAGMDELGFLGGGGGGGAPAPVGGAPGMPGGSGNARRDFALAIAQGIGSHHGLHGVDLQGLLTNLHAGLAAEGDPAAAAAPAAGPAAPAGSYVFPVEGASSFTDDWGAPRVGHTHAGIDIPAPEGAPLRAITDGVVTAAGPSGAAGNRIWINGKFFYAHLSKFAVKPGDHVKAGQVIGYVGSTGDATGPHLHFGWSPDASQGASWANPYKLLAGLAGK